MAYIPIADQTDEMHDPQSFITKYIWSHPVWRHCHPRWPVSFGLVSIDASAIGVSGHICLYRPG